MALTYQAPYLQGPKITPQSWVNADSANTKKTIHTAGANGSKITGIIATSTDTSTRILQLWLTRSATNYLLASVTVAVTAGSDGTTAGNNVLTNALFPGVPVDNDGQAYLFLESGDTLKVSFTTQVTAGKEIDVACIGSNF